MKWNLKKILRNVLICIIICFSCTQKVGAWWFEANRSMWIALYNEENSEISYNFYDQEKTDLIKTLKQITDGKILNFSNPNGYIATNTGTNSDFLNSLIFPCIDIDNTSVETNSQDYNQGEDVVGNLIQSLNSAIAYVRSFSSEDLSDVKVNEIAEALATATNSNISEVYGIRTYKGSYGNTETTSKAYKSIQKEIQQIEQTWGKGVSENDYIILYSEDGGAVCFMWNSPSGYGNGQYLADSKKGYTSTINYISWKNIVTIASTAKNNGVTIDTGGFEKIASANRNSITKALAEFADDIIKFLSVKFLGFYSLESMILNRGTRGTSYYLGMMPRAWFNQSNNIFWLMEILAVFILFASVLYTVYKENYAIVSPRERINLQDRIQNLIISIILLILYVPIFYLMGKFNQSIVELLDSLVIGKEFISSTNVSVILSLVMAIVDLIIMVKLNIDYLVRALTITVLHALAPAMIASISLSSDPKNSMFSVWLKEMTSAIFMQSFDAVILVLFMIVSKNGGSARWWEIALMTFMFIPMNKWFKDKFGGGTSIGSMAQATAQSAGKALSATTEHAKKQVNIAGGTIANVNKIQATKAGSIKEGIKGIEENGKGKLVPKVKGEDTNDQSISFKKDEKGAITIDKKTAISSNGNTDKNSKTQKVLSEPKTQLEKFTQERKEQPKTDTRIKEQKPNASDIFGAFASSVAKNNGFNGVSDMIDSNIDKKYKNYQGISNEFSTGDNDIYDSKGQLKRTPTNLEARQYGNSENPAQKEYKQELAKNRAEINREFDDLDNLDEIEQKWNEEFAPEIANNMGMSVNELNSMLNNDEAYLKNWNSDVINKPENADYKQALINNRKAKMEEIYANSKTNTKFDQKYPNEEYRYARYKMK